MRLLALKENTPKSGTRLLPRDGDADIDTESAAVIRDEVFVVYVEAATGSVRMTMLLPTPNHRPIFVPPRAQQRREPLVKPPPPRLISLPVLRLSRAAPPPPCSAPYAVLLLATEPELLVTSALSHCPLLPWERDASGRGGPLNHKPGP
jgi:hypothetical protein